MLYVSYIRYIHVHLPVQTYEGREIAVVAPKHGEQSNERGEVRIRPVSPRCPTGILCPHIVRVLLNLSLKTQNNNK